MSVAGSEQSQWHFLMVRLKTVVKNKFLSQNRGGYFVFLAKANSNNILLLMVHVSSKDIFFTCFI